jgi:hypothetical protein
MKNEHYIEYLEKVALALLQNQPDFQEVHYEHANPDESSGYFIPFNIKQIIKKEREERIRNSNNIIARLQAMALTKAKEFEENQNHTQKQIAEVRAEQTACLYCVGITFISAIAFTLAICRWTSILSQ